MSSEPPAWVASAQTEDDEYMRLFTGRERGPGKPLDLYFEAAPDPGRPLVLFQHIRKTGGTALRNLIYSNRGSATLEIVRTSGKRPRQLAKIHEELYESLGERRDRLVCVAGHTANYLIPLVGSRPVRALTLLRDPVEHVASAHYFFRRDERSTLEERFGAGGGISAMKPGAFNPQAQSLLEPHYDAALLPPVASDPGAELWRERLFEVVDRFYLVGLQDRFLHSLALFAEKLGWTTLYPASSRVNWTRPREPLGPDVEAAIRRLNWLDEELYRRTLERFDRDCPAWPEPEWL
jgi:hypothetical protein